MRVRMEWNIRTAKNAHGTPESMLQSTRTRLQASTRAQVMFMMWFKGIFRRLGTLDSAPVTDTASSDSSGRAVIELTLQRRPQGL